jgi:DNA-binding winged helix-turn-helix (wHTH) protein/tetratricopeptide (TPR) repeat protein
MPANGSPAAPDTSTCLLADMRLSLAELRLYGADGRPIALERKAFDLLAFLVGQRARVVTKDELLQSVWGRSIASDSVIAQAVSKARKALLQGGGDPDWIDVARGVGYRYVGPVGIALPAPDVPGATGGPIAPPVRRWRWAAAAGVLVAVGVAAGAWWQQQAALRDPLRIAVLPWRNDTGDAAFDWTRLGLQGLVVDALASDRRVVPVAQSSVRALLAARPDLADAQAQAEYLGAATGAQHVLAGRLSRDAGGVHVELVVLGDSAADSARLSGDSAAEVALAASATVTRRLLPGFDPERPQPLSRVAFANEAYARGVDARLAGQAEDAARHLQAALAADPDMLAARYQLAVAWQLLRRNDDWRRALDELLALAQARGDRLHEGQALSGLGLLAWREGRLDEAAQLLAAAGDRFDGPNDGLRRAGVEGNQGSLAAMRGDFAAAEAALRRALAAFEGAGQRVDVARVSKNLGVLSIDRGDMDQAADWIERSLRIRQALGLERDLAESLTAMASIDMAREQPAAAEASYERAAAIFARFGDPLLESDTLARLSNALVAQGRLTDAAAAAGRSLAAARSADNPAARGLAHLKLAWIARLRGDRAGAAVELERARPQFEQAQDRRGRIRIDLELAELALPGRSADARAAIERALAAVEPGGDRHLRAEALLLRARLPDADPRAARDDLDQATALAHASGDGELATLVACAVVVHDAGNLASGGRDGDDDRVTGGAPVAAPAEPPRASGDPPGAALARCELAGMGNAAAASALADHARARGDAVAEARWWRQRRQLAGEAWSDADQLRLRELERTAGTPR